MFLDIQVYCNFHHQNIFMPQYFLFQQHWSVEMVCRWSEGIEKEKVQQWLSLANLGIDSKERGVLFQQWCQLKNTMMMTMIMINHDVYDHDADGQMVKMWLACHHHLCHSHHHHHHLHYVYHLHHRFLNCHHPYLPTTSTLTLSWPSTFLIKIIF